MRLFIAIPLPKNILRTAFAAEQELQKASTSGRFVPEGNHHITVRFLGESDALADFEWSEDGSELLRCAAGHEPASCSGPRASGQVRAVFDASQCAGCPFEGQCRPKVSGGRAAIVKSAKGTKRARHARRMGEEGFVAYARLRNGVETVPSNLRRNYRLDKLPRGRIRGKLFFGAKIAALNFRKLVRFLAGDTRQSDNPLLAAG